MGKGKCVICGNEMSGDLDNPKCDWCCVPCWKRLPYAESINRLIVGEREAALYEFDRLRDLVMQLREYVIDLTEEYVVHVEEGGD